MITVEPLFGLCNRLRMLDDVLSIADQCRMPIRLVWNRNADLNCRFDELFQIPDGIMDLVQPRRHFLKKYAGPLISIGTPEFHLDVRLKNLHPLRMLLSAMDTFGMHGAKGELIHMLRRINKLVFTHHRYERIFYLEEARQLFAKEYDFTGLCKHRSVYMQGYTRLLNSMQIFDRFKPVERIGTKIENICSSFAPHTVGVHIRRTDNTVSAEESPTARFIFEMKREIARNPDTMFFLATDSPAEERAMRNLFPDKVISYEKSRLNRGDPQAIKDALVDLCCLSRTRGILASFGSTFSRTAASMGRIPCRVVLRSRDEKG